MTDDPLAVDDLTATHVGDTVHVEGKLAKVTEKKPLLETGSFDCRACGQPNREDQPRLTIKEPGKCESCDAKGPFRLNPRDSVFTDQRKLKLEMPPDAGAASGQSIAVFVKGDVCDEGGENGLPDRAGSTAVVTGRYELDTTKLGKPNATPEFDTWLDAEAIDFPDDDSRDVNVDEHIDEIEALASGDDPISHFRDNIVPTLDVDDRFETVLEAAVAWLFGAYRIDVDEGTYRGDIHMCVIGDPGTGKSTLLSELATISHKCEYRSGEGVTEAGLTAAAIQEEFAGTSKWTLEPGVLPRANGGHCIIDEVDKSASDTTDALHDALEGEQMVKVDKAGMTASLPTRTGTMFSGNPIHGRFDRHEPIAEQIDLDPALISRMDILLDLPDEVDEAKDRSKAHHYLESYDELSRVELYERGHIDDEPELVAAARDIDTEVLRAWVAHARDAVFPTLTDAAKTALEAFYVDVRDLNGGHKSDAETIPATPRTLGAGVRLAVAFARVELSETVEQRHVDRAIAISKDVVGMNYDPETNEFDANKTDTGEMSRWRRVYRTIADIEEANDGSVPIDAAISAVVTRTGLDERSAEHEIDKLMQKGELYEPENDELRTT